MSQWYLYVIKVLPTFGNMLRHCWHLFIKDCAKLEQKSVALQSTQLEKCFYAVETYVDLSSMCLFTSRRSSVIEV